MKVTAKVSKYVIDRRKRFASGFLALILAIVGIKVATGTGSDQDPDRDLVFLVSTALDRCQVFYASRYPGYQPAEVVLFEGSTSTGCGVGLTQSGPFLCARDHRAYVDLAFLRALSGDLARAYVIAHELGHEVQVSLHRDTNRPSIELELEADCLAGSWARDEQLAGRLDPGDVAGALAEAAAVGDDRVCPSCPEQFRHGTSDQRVAAFARGLAGAPCW